jgi:surfactin synthase thioesterase subunit
MREAHRLRLYCFPHAGAGTSCFGRWPAIVGPDIEVVPVTLPGRGTRRREPRVTDPDTLLDHLFSTLGPPPWGPCVLYGHSLGALVAYTLARALGRAGSASPLLVVAGASRPPAAPVPVLEGPDPSDDVLVGMMRELGAVPSSAVPGGVWRRTTLPVLRDDRRLARALSSAAGAPLEIPLMAVAGSADPLAGPPVMAGWRQWTTERFIQRTVPGDHFFVQGTHLPRLLRRACLVAERLETPAAFSAELLEGVR